MGGGCLVPFVAPSMVANMGIAESELPIAYVVGGVCALVSMPVVGWLSDHVNRLRLLTGISVAAAAVAVIITQLGASSLGFVSMMMAFFMVTMSGRFAPAMTMITNAVESRYRGGFMAVNAALQQAASALATALAGVFVTRDPAGHLVGYHILGYIAVGFFALTVVLAAVLRNAAPHVAIPATKKSALAEPLATAA